MAAAGVAVNCYWNGRVKKENNDVVYEGAKVTVMPIKLFHGTTYAGLLDKIYAITAIDRQNFELNIICRYPISSQEYKPIPIKNDEGVELMLEVPSRSGVYCVEIYLEQEPAPLRVEATAPINVKMCPSTPLLTNETNAVEMGDGGLADKSLSINDSNILPMPLSYSICKNNGEPSSKHSTDSPKIEDNKVLIGNRRKWEELNINCLVNIFQKVGMEALLLDVPFVCKSWYKASLNPMCWQHLIFPENFDPFAKRLTTDHKEGFPITAFIKFIINRSSRCATTLMLPFCCSQEGLEYAAKECPALKVFGLHGFLSHENARLIPKLIRNWKDLEVLRLRMADNIPEILHQISLHCKNFFQLMLPESYIGDYEESAIVTYLPKIKHLFLKGATIEKKNLVMILLNCRELVRLDVRDCHLFEESDADILELASHIPSFRCEGSTDMYNNEDREIQIALCRLPGNNYSFGDRHDPFDWNFVS